MIELKNVELILRGFKLNNISFRINNSEITYLVGNNGSGKTTLLKCALDIIKINKGRILFDGDSFKKKKNKIMFIQDNPLFYEDYSGLDNLLFINDKLDLEELSKVCELFTFSKKLLHRQVYRYSFGERKKLAIINSLINDYDYYFLDEPTIGLDLQTWYLYKKCLIYLKENKKTILVTGHNYEMIEEIADNIIIINNGKILINEKLNNFIGNYHSLYERLRVFYNIDI
ncbi:MAG: ATP-binding cassette domain-containing protein [Bacilli bacterium]|jgi:ABC-2 type transport system ATP-binding protein|nr:ATP-binding cassette domain-containing protein [Bacilli bacterium]